VTPHKKHFELLPELFSRALKAMQRSEANNKISTINIKICTNDCRLRMFSRIMTTIRHASEDMT